MRIRSMRANVYVRNWYGFTGVNERDENYFFNGWVILFVHYFPFGFFLSRLELLMKTTPSGEFSEPNFSN